ncbi:MAG: hypothetical protein GWP08_06850 [Nitrospiraceae bacterium]|nr:hypothetical protein [Nitrospiraceae bacterium]
MSGKAKPVLTAVAVIAVGYFIVLPWMWGSMEPTAQASIPSEWTLGEDLPLQIVIDSWHNNYKLVNVRFYIDHTQTKLEGVDQAPYPIQLLQEARPTRWTRLSLNRLTYPRREIREVVVPLADLKAKGELGPGVLAGYLDIELGFVGSLRYATGGPGADRVNTRTQKIPFSITLR